MGVSPAVILYSQDFWQTVTMKNLQPHIGPFSISGNTDGNLSCLVACASKPAWQRSSA